MATVGLEGVWKRYGKVEAVKGISMEIGDGEFVALLGPSGCGKTSTMRMIAGLEEISAGDIRFDGKSVIDRPPRARNVAMAFENYALYPTLSVYENLAFPARAAHWPNDRIDKRVREVAAIAAIDKLLDRRTGELSSGQAQMVGLARALVREPAVFLLDEPISHVDARLRIDMRTYIKRLQVELGYTMVLVTHDQEDAMALADRIAVMADGQLRQLGTPAEVYDHPEDAFVANFIGSPPINLFDCQLEQTGGKAVLRRDGLTFDLPDQFVPLAAAGKLPARVTVGIRPFHLTAGAVAGHGAIPARVVVVEPLGDMEIVTAEAADVPVQVVIPPGNRPSRDDTMHLALEPEYVLLFDPDSKQAIHAPSDHAAARAATAQV